MSGEDTLYDLDMGDAVRVGDLYAFRLLPALYRVRAREHTLSKPQFQARLRACGWAPTVVTIEGERRRVWARSAKSGPAVEVGP